MFISMMPMIFIFGFGKKYLLEKKLGHFEKSFRTGMGVTTPIPGSVINLRAFFKSCYCNVLLIKLSCTNAGSESRTDRPSGLHLCHTDQRAYEFPTDI